MYQQTIIIGNLGADPETRTTGGGTTVANLRVAVNERRKVDGEYVQATEWFRVVCFGKLAENVGQYLTKGRQVHVVGKMRTNKWTDNDGNDRYTTELIADQVHFLGAAGGRSEGDAEPRRGTPQNYRSNAADDDLPF